MRLTKRQLDVIAGLINEEAGQRNSLHSQMYRSRRNSLLVEADVYDNMNPDDLGTALAAQMDQDVLDSGSQVRVDFDKNLFAKLAKLISQAGGEKVSGPVLMDDLEDFDADQLAEIQMELASDITAALDKYMKEISLLATHAKLSGVEG